MASQSAGLQAAPAACPLGPPYGVRSGILALRRSAFAGMTVVSDARGLLKKPGYVTSRRNRVDSSVVMNKDSLPPPTSFAGLALDRVTPNNATTPSGLPRNSPIRARVLCCSARERPSRSRSAMSDALRIDRRGRVGSAAARTQRRVISAWTTPAARSSRSASKARSRARCRSSAGDFIDPRSAGHASASVLNPGLFAYARGLAHWQSPARAFARCAARPSSSTAGHRARCTQNSRLRDRTFPARVYPGDDRDRLVRRRSLACSVARPRGPNAAIRRSPDSSSWRIATKTPCAAGCSEKSGVRVGDVAVPLLANCGCFLASLMIGFTAEATDPTIRPRRRARR